jgi:23S rRNA (cytosine1962-C5)-methyltransferase
MSSPPLASVAATNELRLHLRPGREKAVREGHPWLFSGAIARAEGPPAAPLARVFAADGTPLAVGFHSPKSDLRVRLVGAVGAVDESFFARRLAAALALRAELLPRETTGYRVVNAEGDGVPGWTVDRFADVLVSQVTCFGLEQVRAEAYAALRRAFPGARVLQRNRLPARRGEGLPLEDEVVDPGDPAAAAISPSGLAPLEGPGAQDREVWFRESGLWFAADLSGGQKTGFYFDQRDNRRLVRELAAGREVLDLFANTGAFATHALVGGAREVVAVESADRLAALADRHLAANGIERARLSWEAADVFAFLRGASARRYGLVVCDPPPLARHRGDVGAAARAYKDLNRLALGRLAAGGLMVTFSCSGGVDAKLFRQILFAAAGEAGVEVQLLRPLAAALDHPVAITHPQGEYLKGWLLRVVGARAATSGPV